jgi:hypothetical protein
MKSLLIIAALAFTVLSCKTSSNAELDSTSKEEIANDGSVNGTVYVSLKGCPALILVDNGTDQVRYYPVNLSDEYKQDGLKISFTFVPSRAMQPEGCTLVDMVVSVDNVKKVR